MSRVEFHPLADQELTATALFYESRAHGLGTDFLDEAERLANNLAQFPELGAPLRGTLRRLALRRFPYSLLYRIETDRIYILAVMHHRRRPGYWTDRT